MILHKRYFRLIIIFIMVAMMITTAWLNDNKLIAYGDTKKETEEVKLTPPVIETKSYIRGMVKISWKKSEKVSGYEIYQRKRDDDTYTKVKNVGGKKTSTTLKIFTIETEDLSEFENVNYKAPAYYYKVRSYQIIDKKKVYSQFSKPGFTVVALNNELKPLGEISNSRYTKNSKGVYEKNKVKTKNEANIMLTGDIMCQGGQQQAAKTTKTYNFNKSFSKVKPLFSKADFVIGNLETVLSITSPYMSQVPAILNPVTDTKPPHCNAPSTFLDGLKYAGFDGVVNANNHNCDDGKRGIRSTLKYLDKYKLLHTGMFNENWKRRYLLTDINGIKVAFISYSQKYNSFYNTIEYTDRNRMLNLYYEDRIKRDVANARKAGAEFIIAYNHWGTEYMMEYDFERNTEAKTAQEMADAGVDLIVGSHPHVLQTAALITAQDGRTVPIIYSMGNFISHQTREGFMNDGTAVPNATQDTIILNLILSKKDGKVSIKELSYIPCHTLGEYNKTRHVVTPTNSNFNGGIEGDEGEELAKAEERIKAIIGTAIEEKTSNN